MVPVSIPAVCGGGGEGDGGCGDGEGGGCEDERVVVSVNSGDGALVPVRDSSLDSSPDQVLGPRLSGSGTSYGYGSGGGALIPVRDSSLDSSRVWRRRRRRCGEGNSASVARFQW